MEEEAVEGIATKNGDPNVNEEIQEDEDGTFDDSKFPELERTQTGRKTSIFKYYSFKEKGESGRFVFDKILILKESLHRC